MGFFDFGRSFLNSIPLQGGFTTALWGDPSQDAHQDAMSKAQGMMGQQRSDMMDARMNAMSQGSLAFGPRNQMLGQMMGQRGPNAQAMNLQPMMQNPMSPGMQAGIRQAAFGSAPPTAAPPGIGGGPAPSNGQFTGGMGMQPKDPYGRY